MTAWTACVAIVCVALSGGCGGGGGANVVTVSVNPPNLQLILGTSVNLTATVGGANNPNVNWGPLQYTTTPSNGKTTSPTNAPTDGSFGALSNAQTMGTITYTAPDPSKFSLPDPKTYPNLRIVVTATSVQNPKKSGTSNIQLISGISIALAPITASVPTGEPQQFSVQLNNDLKSQGVTWAITQQLANSQTTTSNSTPPPNPYFGLATCSPTCGTITPDPNSNVVAVYTAPMTIPTAITPAEKNNNNPPAEVTIVATSVADNSRIAVGTITIVQGGPIKFNGITPTIAPQGATLWDIYLDAPNISSASTVFINGAPKVSSSGQVKILFPLPTTATTTTNGVTTTTTVTGSPTGARLRLLASDLATAGPVTITVSDPAQTCNGITAGMPCTATGTGTFTIIPVRPTSIATVPDDVVQGKTTPSTPVIVDGGYFGPSGNLAEVVFQGSAIGQNPNNSTTNHLDAVLSTANINSGNPGLYPLSVQSSNPTPPAVNNPSVTNIALFPDYSATPPQVTASGIPAGTNPSAVDEDSNLAVLVVAETGSNAVQFYKIGQGSLTPIDSTGAACVASCPVAVGKLPTGLSVNRANHTVGVVNFQDQTVTVLPIPGAPQQAPGTPFTVDLSGALQNAVAPPIPMPYSIAIDPDTNLALVAYSVTSPTSAANLGFVLNLNPNTADANGNPTNSFGCILGQAINQSSNKYGQCIFSQVTLNNGVFPQVAVSPHGHKALVTPGGAGFIRGVDITQQATGNVLKSLTLTANVVTATVDTSQCPPGVVATNPTSTTNRCPLMMVPGAAGTVLITNVPPGGKGTNFNGTFAVNVLSNTTFSYALPPSTVQTDSASGSCTLPNGPCTSVFYGTPDQIFSISSTLRGVAINPVTNTAAMADADATSFAQIDLLNGLDQSFSSINFSANCTALIVPCAGGPEFIPTADVAWQPYTNEVVSYNPKLNQVSISDPVTGRRFAFACEVNSGAKTMAGTTCITNPNTAPASVCPVAGLTCQQMFQNQITLQGRGTASLTNLPGGMNMPPMDNLFGGLAVDPVTNQAFVVMSGSSTIDVIDLGGPGTATPIKPTHISELLVPSPMPGPGQIGGLPGGLVPQATLSCTPPPGSPAGTCNLPGVKIFGSGFSSGLSVRLDGVDITTQGGTIDSIAANGREVDVTIPAYFLSLPRAPHHYSLDILSGGVQSNSVEFIVIHSIDMSKICPGTGGSAVNTMPTAVAVVDQLANGPFSPIAVVTNQGCNSISAIDIDPTSQTYGQLKGNPISVGTGPQGIAISQRHGLAVVANNSAGTASLIDLTKSPPAQLVPDVATGTNPVGVAINDPTAVAIVANNGSNQVTAINFGVLFPTDGSTPPNPLPTKNIITIGGVQNPLAVAIDPDRGQNNQGIAVVTSVQLTAGSAATGALLVIEIGFATPSLSTIFSPGFVLSTPTGIVFDPAVGTRTENPGVFFANSSGTNAITEFNPDPGGGGSTVSVGINPTSLAVNPQTGAILTANSASNTVSVVDILSSPFKTRQTLGIPGSPTSGVAIDQFTNLAVIVDQANMRVLLFPMPN